MKFMIASDIHGSAYWCSRLMEAYKAEKPDRLLLLGDILYHGPRNDLPRDYEPKRVANLLNSISDKIICVRGNCDGEIDQKVLDFSILSEQALIIDEGLEIYVNHGHKNGEDAPPPMPSGSVLLCGHTHVPAFNRHEGFTYVNPGSTSIPKNGSAHGYLTLENREFVWKDLDGKAIEKHKI